jgi:type IV secretion system protein VirD4
MSQLDAVYGDREARTFATNHGLQILYAPREQRDADEYSAMLGNFTERSTSQGRSQSLGPNGTASVSRNESPQRRALLLPQEFKELGTERLVVICENCKPILGQKIRYHRDKVFTSRLRPAPPLPRMDIELHLAKVQQRWRYLTLDLPADEGLNVEPLAHEMPELPNTWEGTPSQAAAVMLDFFSPRSRPSAGGAVEPAPDEDGVLLTGNAAESGMSQAAVANVIDGADPWADPGTEDGTAPYGPSRPPESLPSALPLKRNT